MKSRVVLVSFLMVVLSSCGPIIGQMMKGSEGISEFEVTQGDLATLHPVGSLLVFGPFAKTRDAFYISRGEDAANFAAEMKEQGVMDTRLYIERDFDRLEEVAKGLRGKRPQEIKNDLGLDFLPGTILFGTILHRKTIIAPARGVIMDVGYRLEFYDTESGQSTILEVSIRDLAQDCIPKLVTEISKRRSQND